MNRKSYTCFPMSHQPRFYAAPNFLKMGYKYLNLSSFIQVLTIKDKKSAAKFHYMKNVSGKVVAQSIAFRVVSIRWHRGRLLPPEILAETDPPPPVGSEFWHILPCSASTVRDRKEVQLHLTKTRHGLSNEPSTKVIRCPLLPQNGDK